MKVNEKHVTGIHPFDDTDRDTFSASAPNGSLKEAWPALPLSPASWRPLSASHQASETQSFNRIGPGNKFTPRLGAFEVSFEFSDDMYGIGHLGSRTSGFLHSKLQTCKWPNMALLLQRLRRALTEYLIGPIDDPLPFTETLLPALEDQDAVQLRANLNKLHGQRYSQTWWYHSPLPLPPKVVIKAEAMLEAAEAKARLQQARDPELARTQGNDVLDDFLMAEFGASETVINLQMELGKKVLSALLSRARGAASSSGVDVALMERAFCKLATTMGDAEEVMGALLRESTTLLTDVLAATIKQGVRREDGFLAKMTANQAKDNKVYSDHIEALKRLKENETLRGLLKLQESVIEAEAEAAREVRTPFRFP
eukprot:3730414-Pleurochrysis_carterae.AAC.1